MSSYGQASIQDVCPQLTQQIRQQEEELVAKRCELQDQIEKQEEEFSSRLRKLDEKEADLQKREEHLASIIGSQGDVLEISAGGRVFSVTRGTMCLAEGSVFAALFSGRWEQGMSRDSSGRPFLDVDPDLFEAVVNFLRAKRMLGTSDAMPLPEVPEKKSEAFDLFLRFYGLKEFIYGVSLPSNMVDLSPPLTAGQRYMIHHDEHARGYILKFSEKFLLLGVHVGFADNTADVVILVGKGGTVLKQIPAVLKNAKPPLI